MTRARVSRSVECTQLARRSAIEIDLAYSAYDDQPLDRPDEWGDLGSFREATEASQPPTT